MTSEKAVRFRWCGVAFYQIILPDGTVIITDPAQYQYPRNMVAEDDYLRYSDRSAADILDRVDYVLISHIHFDHVQDLTQILTKFPDARIIVPDSSAVALLLEKNFSTLSRNFFAVGHKDELRFPEFRLESYAGKHTVFSSTDPFLAHVLEQDFRKDYRNEDGSIDYIGAMFMAAGGFDPRNYVLTLPDGMKIFLWAGQILEDFRKFLYMDMKPDMMFVQIAGTNIGGDRNDPKADAICSFAEDVKPQVVLPIHQEKYTKECLELISTRCNECFSEHNSSIRYENTGMLVWYSAYRGDDGKLVIEKKE